jgi:microcystin-dependent protein
MVIQNPIPQSGNSVFENLYVYGDADFTNNVSISANLTVKSPSFFQALTTIEDKLVVGSAVTVSSGNIDAAGVVTATKFVGSGADLTGIVSIPTGVIVMWSGTTIPSGWALCDGTNSTPDLRNRFIVGANDASKTGITTQTGPGFNVTTGVIDDTYEPGDIGGETSHQLTVAELAAHTHTEQYNVNSSGQDQAGSGSGDNDNTSTQNSGSTGGNNYHENRPPYYALAFIMKT